jgi:hypothetical protein
MPSQADLFDKIMRFTLDEANVSFSFSDRLAREQAWKLDYTLRTISEYKKFIYLLCVAQHPLTPSDQVDQVWHLHLLYTQSYWHELCRDTLGRDIHHGPTKGGQQERDKFTNWYDKTKTLYEKELGYAPPPDIWPDSDTRFSDIFFQRVNLKKNWIIPKPFKNK